jgi:hypothetical protein
MMINSPKNSRVSEACGHIGIGGETAPPYRYRRTWNPLSALGAGALAPWLLLLPGPAQAQEVTSFQYDTLGRLRQVTVTGGPATGNLTIVEYDPPGNRQRYTVTGARDRPPIKPVIVVPLNGYTIIPIRPR